MQWLAIGLGAALGACLRSWLSRFNTLDHWLPFGTLAANILGGLLIGAALVVFARLGSELPPQAQGFVVTGFLGGLTTFSSFSAEVFGLLNSGKLMSALVLIGLHVSLTLLATALGYWVIKGVW